MFNLSSENDIYTRNRVDPASVPARTLGRWQMLIGECRAPARRPPLEMLEHLAPATC
jgi:hypothetical protein